MEAPKGQVKWRYPLLLACFLALSLWAQPSSPPKRDWNTDPPQGMVQHLTTVRFTPPMGQTNYLLTELQTCTNLANPDWQPVGWFPGNSIPVTMDFSNNVDSVPHFFRTVTFGQTGPLTNPISMILKNR